MSSKSQQKPAIDDFNGYYQFLNNDYATWIQFQGLLFPSVTTAFQASRTGSIQIRKQISQIQDYQQFSSLIQRIKNPQNWYSLRYKTMQKLIRDKFKRNKQLANKLAQTQQRKLYNVFKNNGDNQNYWGVTKLKNQNGKFQYKGANMLGKILQAVRLDVIKLTDTEKWVMFQNLEEDQELFPECSLTVLKDNLPVDKLALEKNNYFLFGSHPKCQFKLEHPSISKFHAAIFFSQLQVILVDTNSSHGTFITQTSTQQRTKLQPLKKTVVKPGMILTFGLSFRSYVVNLSFINIQKALKTKEQEIQKNISSYKQVNSITSHMNSDQIKSKIGFKKYQALYVKNINSKYTYNQIKELFQKFGSIDKIRLIQNHRNTSFQQVIVCYQNKHKIEDIIKAIKYSDQKSLTTFDIKPIDKYQTQNILDSNRQNRQKHRQKEKRSRSRSRDRQRKNKHKKYDRHQR